MSSRVVGDPERSFRVTWEVHLARQQPERAAVAVLVIAAASVTIAVVAQNAFWPVLTAAALFFSLNDFFLPIRYTLDDIGIQAAGWVSRRSMEWSSLRRFAVNPLGIKVSPLSSSSRLEPFRGIFLYCSEDVRERVVDLLRTRIEASEADSEAA